VSHLAHLAASHSEHVAERGSVTERTASWDRRLAASVPLAWRRSGIAVLGVLAAASVGYAASKNPLASPSHVAVELRVAIIVAQIAAGLYAQTSELQARMGGLLVGAGFFSAVWLLNGSSNRALFSIGVVGSGVAPLLFAYLMLAHPSGHLFSPRDARFLRLTGGSAAVLWLLGVLMTLQPPLRSPLLQCRPHCPANAFSLGSADDAVGVVQAAIWVAWLSLSVGTPILLVRRARSSPAPVRRSLVPVVVVAAAIPILLTVYAASIATGWGPTMTLGGIYVAEVLVIPIAILAGLGRERSFMGQMLAQVIEQLARLPAADPEVLLAAALRDPSLRIAYRRPGLETYVDSHGVPISEFPADAAVTWIERGGMPVAAVLCNAELARDKRYVQAAGAAALIRLEKAQLEADLKASTSDLAASRVRLLDMAHSERRRLERDLHDGVQQHLVGLRIKLDVAAGAIKDDPTQGERALASVGQQMDDVLHEVRSLARGIYPSLLTERGVVEALRAAARSSLLPVEVRGRVGRYPEEVEVAVYFCCLEALQNVTKHAGPDATATVSLWGDGHRLGFEVRDAGIGFNPRTASRGRGLINMRDRIEAVGGRLEVSSCYGQGTAVRGSVPIDQPAQGA
jgi:signal transduction histidine kinase